MSLHGCNLLTQYTANAIVLFPKIAADYVAICAKVGISDVDTNAFEIWVRPVEEDRYQAVLYCKTHNNVVAAGKLVSRGGCVAVEDALGSLLTILIDGSAKCLAARVGDDGKASNVNKIGWISSKQA